MCDFAKKEEKEGNEMNFPVYERDDHRRKVILNPPDNEPTALPPE